MDIASKLCTRLGELRTARAVHEAHWSECYKFGAPERQQSFSGGDATQTRKSERAGLLDSTAAEAMQILVSSIISGTTPANAQWFKAVPDGVDDPAELTEGERWLEQVCAFLWRNIHAANFDNEAPDTVTDTACIGWGVLYIDIDRKDGGFVFENWPTGTCFIASTRADGRIDTIFREHEMAAIAMVNEYGESNCSEAVRRAASDKPDTKFKLIHAIMPRDSGKVGQIAKAKPFASYHIEIAGKSMLRESGYDEFPCAIPRWRKTPGSCYATGQMAVALPNAKTADKLMETTLQSADLAIGGMWAAKDDGILNPHTVKIGPRKVIVMNDPDSMKRLDTGVQWQVSEMLLDKLQGTIRKQLMADNFPPYGQPMTAAETYARQDLIRQMLGPMYGRFQAEFLIPLLERCFGLAFRTGVLGEPPEDLINQNVSFKFTSPLARAQQLEDVAAVEQFIAAVSQVSSIDQTILDNVNFDAAAQVIGRGRGVPAQVMRSNDEMQQMREERQAAQQQMQEQARAQQQEDAVGQAMLDSAVQQPAGSLPA